MGIEEHFSKTHSVHGLLLGLSEFWKSAPQFRVVALSAQQSRVFFSSHLPTLQLCSIAPSQLLAPRSGMGYLWRSECSLGLSLTPFTLI